MRTLITIATLIAITTAYAPAASAGHNCDFSRAGRCKVSGNKVPASPAQFKALRAKLPKDVFHAAALYIYSLIAYADDPKRGEQMMLLASHESELQKGNVYKGYGWRTSMKYMMRMARKYRHCFAGFASNAKQSGGKYVVDRNNAEVELRIQTKYVPNPASGRAKLWVCPVNRRCFPLSFRQSHIKSNGQAVKVWKAYRASSAFTGCRRAKQAPTVNPDL